MLEGLLNSSYLRSVGKKITSGYVMEVLKKFSKGRRMDLKRRKDERRQRGAIISPKIKKKFGSSDCLISHINLLKSEQLVMYRHR